MTSAQDPEVQAGFEAYLSNMLLTNDSLRETHPAWFEGTMEQRIMAYLTVLMTYFGVNFLLGGIHSYA